jgi:hypothetical protein
MCPSRTIDGVSTIRESNEKDNGDPNKGKLTCQHLCPFAAAPP